jgi:hypothetical protein
VILLFELERFILLSPTPAHLDNTVCKWSDKAWLSRSSRAEYAFFFFANLSMPFRLVIISGDKVGALLLGHFGPQYSEAVMVLLCICRICSEESMYRLLTAYHLAVLI